MSAYKPTLAWFRGRMAEKLEANIDKGSWRGESWQYLIGRLNEECRELEEALLRPSFGPDVTIEDFEERRKDIIAECSDVANFAMMIADNAARGLS